MKMRKLLPTIKSRGGLSSFLILASLSTILLLSLFLSILPSTNKAKALGEGDTGKATLNNLTLDISDKVTSPNKPTRIKTVTINGTTLTEQQPGTGTNDYAKILNNNTVLYNINYTITTPGTITLVFTLPANNYIDPSSVSTAAGCLDGSKVQKATINNKASVTNNQAICIINPTATGVKQWQIKANPWGVNNEAITPTIRIGQTEQAITKSNANTIVTVGKPNYSMDVGKGTGFGISDGFNREASLNISPGLYDRNDSATMLGVEALDADATVSVNMTDMPSDWVIIACAPLSWNGYYYISDCSSNGDTLSFTFHGTTASSILKGYLLGQLKMSNGYNSIRLGVPISSLPEQATAYTLAITPPQFNLNNNKYTLPLKNTTISWMLSNANSSSPRSWWGTLPGWGLAQGDDQPIYPGESMTSMFNLGFNNQSTIDFCHVWNPREFTIISDYTKGNATFADHSAEYGVISIDGTQDDINSIIAQCGVVGDGKSGKTFFANKSDAEAYATESAGIKVNVVRLHAEGVASGRNVGMGQIKMRYIGDNFTGTRVKNIDSVLVNGDSSIGDSSSPVVIPGLISHAITAQPSSTPPNTESHITITPYTYNKDTNTKITLTLPKGLTLKTGSFKWGNRTLIEGSDYVVTTNDDGSSTIIINLGSIGNDPTYETDPITGQTIPIASDNNGKGVEQPPIEFDVVVGSDVVTPSTLTITSTTSGTGTDKASSNFKTASTNIAVATKKEFNYSLQSSAKAIAYGDDLTYTYTVSNNTDNPITNLDEIAVLPYNEDSRGTTGLIDRDSNSSGNATAPYTISKLSVVNKAGQVDKDAELYYTTNTKVRDYEKVTSQTEANKLASDTSITWIPYDGVNAIPTNITAIRFKKATLASNTSNNISLTLANINMDNPTNTVKPTINNDITYINTKELGNAIHQLPTTTTYTGEQIGLSITNPDIQMDLNPNTAKTDIAQTLNYTVNTENGYTLSLQTTKDLRFQASQNSLANQLNISFDSKSTEPVVGINNWAVKFIDQTNNPSNTPTWHSLKTTNAPYTLLTTNSRTKLQSAYSLTYSISTDYNLPAGTYIGQVTYTITAGI